MEHDAKIVPPEEPHPKEIAVNLFLLVEAQAHS
jgi:hypothetical protein